MEENQHKNIDVGGRLSSYTNINGTLNLFRRGSIDTRVLIHRTSSEGMVVDGYTLRGVRSLVNSDQAVAHLEHVIAP